MTGIGEGDVGDVGERRSRAADLRGAARLAIAATLGTTDTVEAMHATIGRRPPILGGAPVPRTHGIARLVYGSVRGITRAVGTVLDVGLRAAAALPGDDRGWRGREAFVAALNGVLGDRLAAEGNHLATTMTVFHDGRALALDGAALEVPGATSRLLLLVHGACMHEGGWLRHGHDHGASLAKNGYTPLYLRYNSGLHISENGAALATLLETMVARWPVPVAEIVILCHSMGGLVARSACHQAQTDGLAWLRSLTRLAFLGTPHHGAALERAGNVFETLLGASPYSGALRRFGKVRSAGITDLRFGNVLAADWEQRDRFAPGADPRTPVALPDGVACYAIAATRSSESGGPTAPSDLTGDRLVSVASALGEHADPAYRLTFPEGHTWIGRDMDHFDLLDHAEVAAVLHRWLD